MWVDEFYEVIMQKVMTEVIDEKNIKMLKHFDLDFMQYDQEKKDDDDNSIDAYATPACFFRHEPFDYVSLGMRKKAVDEFIFELTVESEVVQEVDFRTTPAIRNKGHEHLKIVAEIEKVLQGFNGAQVVTGFNGFGSIVSLGGVPYGARGLSMVHKMRFKTRITSDNTTVSYTKISDLQPPIVAADDITITQL